MSDLTGKVAFITGGGSGIGRGMAERLAKDGADIFIADIDTQGAELTANLVTQLGRKAVVIKANTASLTQMAAAAKACVDEFGRLDIAIANAGIARGGSVLELPLKEWQDQIDVNLTGVFLTVQVTAQQMVKLGNGGRVICLSSLAAERTGAGVWAYSATKAAVRMMVRGWAQELGSFGITVNAIGPGVIETPLAQTLAGEEGGGIRKSLENRTPVGRVGRVEDIAGLTSFLCSRDGEFMTGSYLLMDGGLSDAGPGWMADSDLSEEQERLMQKGMARREKMQPLLDER